MLLLIPLYALMALITSFARPENTVTECEEPTVMQMRRQHHHRHFHRYQRSVYYQQSYYQPSYYQRPTFQRSAYGAMYYGGAHPVIVRQQHIVYTR